MGKWIRWFSAVAVAWALMGLPLDAEDCPVFLVKRGEQGLEMEEVILAEDQVQVWTMGDASGWVDVILPVGPGGSGSDSREGTLQVVRCTKEGVVRQIRHPEGETSFPSRPLEELRRYDTRVSVTGADGTQAAFLLEAYSHIQPDTGPVQNPFSNIPIQLGKNDYVVFTDTYRRTLGANHRGVVPLEVKGYPFVQGRTSGGRRGWFIVDIGAAETLVSKAFLPEGTAIQESSMIEYSSAGRRVLDYSPGGATGQVRGILGHAVISRIHFGEISFDEASVAVMEEIPDLFDRPVVGILGMDLMGRTDRLTMMLPGEAEGKGRLEFGAEPAESPGLVSEIPYSIINHHFMVAADLNGKKVHFIMDTGAPGLLLDAAAAQEVGVEIAEGEAEHAGGLDGGRVDLKSGTIARIALGNHHFEDVATEVAPLSVFKSLRAKGQHVGLMGNSFFGQFERVEIDLDRKRVRFLQ